MVRGESCSIEKLQWLFGWTVSFIEDFQLVFGTPEGGKRAQIQGPNRLEFGEPYTEPVLLAAWAVPGSQAAALLNS